MRERQMWRRMINNQLQHRKMDKRLNRIKVLVVRLFLLRNGNPKSISFSRGRGLIRMLPSGLLKHLRKNSKKKRTKQRSWLNKSQCCFSKLKHLIKKSNNFDNKWTRWSESNSRWSSNSRRAKFSRSRLRIETSPWSIWVTSGNS